MSKMRLDKFLSLAGCGTRSEVKKLMKAGRIKVNGIAEKKPERKIDSEKDSVYNGDVLVVWQPFLCLMFHKPSGCITATEDRFQRTVLDFISHPRKSELFPVGRLDLDTEGLLLLMNDGELSHRLLSPRHHVDKTYFVRAEGGMTQADIEAFEQGMDIGDEKPTLPAKLKILSGEAQNCVEAELTIREGRFHQVRRMFAARGMKVLYLKRTAMAGLALDPALAPGEWRELTEAEAAILRGCQ